jgi:hypothetical protein
MQVAAAGHTIGSHTWSHADLSKLTSDQAKDEIEKGRQRSLCSPRPGLRVRLVIASAQPPEITVKTVAGLSVTYSWMGTAVQGVAGLLRTPTASVLGSWAAG